jgi:hypothetical protein
MDQPTAEQALRRLEPLVGEWTFEAKWPSGKPWPGGGRVTFEWHASGAHVVQRATAELPEAPDNVSVRHRDLRPERYVEQRCGVVNSVAQFVARSRASNMDLPANAEVRSRLPKPRAQVRFLSGLFIACSAGCGPRRRLTWPPT